MAISNVEMHRHVSRHLETLYITISHENEWFKQCVDFFMSDNSNCSVENVSTMVIEQLSLSDFQEIALSSLPANLNNCENKVLNGKYCLQVNTILDVGKSCYSQYNLLLKRDTSNTEIGNTTPATWEPKSRRMLKMMCTDGKQNIMAMEYETLSCLKEPFISGFKIAVNGPVEYRKGVLLLKPSNVHFIGGEVEHLLIKNAPLNVLCRSLGKPELKNPYMFSNIEVANIAAIEVQESHDMRPPRQVDTRPQSIRPPQNSSNQTNNSNSIGRGVITYDDFFDGDDDELLYLTQVAEIETTLTQSNNQVDSVPSTTLSTHQPKTKINKPTVPINNNKEPKKKPVSTVKQTKISDMLSQSTSSSSSSKNQWPKQTKSLFMSGPSTSTASNYSTAEPTLNQNNYSTNSNSMSEQTSGKRVASSPINTKTKKPSTELNFPEIDWEDDIFEMDVDTSNPLIKVLKSASMVKNSKIQVKQNEWICSGIIKEETKQEEVEFSSEVLERLIGISSKEVLQLKNNPMNCASLKEKIEKGIKGAYRKLHLFKGEVTLTYSLDGNKKPIVTNMVI